MTDSTVFTGWDLVLQKTSKGNWKNSIKFIKSNPSIADVKEGFKQLNVYLCRPGYLPIWEEHSYYGMFYLPYRYNKQSLLQHIKRVIESPVSRDENVAIVEASVHKQTFKIWITGDEMAALRLKGAISNFSKDGTVNLRPALDNTWNHKIGFPVRRNTFNNFNDPSLYILSISHDAAKAYAVKCIFETLVMHDPICKPIVAANQIRPSPDFLLEFYIDPTERGPSFQAYEVDEFLVLLTADWKRRILSVCDYKKGYSISCSTNDPSRTPLFTT